ncbi:unnamed protein product, partial [Mesorhabditis spiculigera]
MPGLRTLLGNFTMEIPLALYMLTSFLRFPVFQNLIYEKVCMELRDDPNLCQNVSAYHDDKEIHEKFNHIYFLSTITLLIPSNVVVLFLGAACDIWSTKIPLLIPFTGLVFSTANYIFQAAYMESNVYWLLLSDAIFGVCGGYLGVIGTTMTYSVKATSQSHRSVRIAMMEGSIGLGGTIGYALSGTLRSAVGYTWSFVIHLILQVIGYIYIIAFAKELINQEEREPSLSESGEIGRSNNIIVHLIEVLHGFYRLITKPRQYRTLLWMCLSALALELLIFAGLMDIQYSFLRYTLGWGDKEYGWFSGLSYGLTTATVLLIYPYLKFRGWNDSLLGSLGLGLKIISLIVFAFIVALWMAYVVTVLTMANRFVSTGFRSFTSRLVEEAEQGKLFSLIVLLEGLTALAATSIYNNLYPKTLHIFPGMMILVSAAILLPSLAALLYSEYKIRKEGPRIAEDRRTTTSSLAALVGAQRLGGLALRGRHLRKRVDGHSYACK